MAVTVYAVLVAVVLTFALLGLSAVRLSVWRVRIHNTAPWLVFTQLHCKAVGPVGADTQVFVIGTIPGRR